MDAASLEACKAELGRQSAECGDLGSRVAQAAEREERLAAALGKPASSMMPRLDCGIKGLRSQYAQVHEEQQLLDRRVAAAKGVAKRAAERPIVPGHLVKLLVASLGSLYTIKLLVLLFRTLLLKLRNRAHVK